MFPIFPITEVAQERKATFKEDAMPRSKDVFHIQQCQNRSMWRILVKIFLCNSCVASCDTARNYPVIVFTWKPCQCAHIISQTEMMHILPIFYLHHKHYDAFCARASHCGWEETGDAVSEIIIIICELWKPEEYQGWRLMEILFAVIFLNRKRAQYYNNVFWANFSEMFIISFDYPFRSFSFLKTGAAFKRIVSKHSISSVCSWPWICMTEKQTDIWTRAPDPFSTV